MFNVFLQRTLPDLERRSAETGYSFAVFIFETVVRTNLEQVYYSEKILITDGEIDYRHIFREPRTTEENFEGLKNRVPTGVEQIYEYIKTNRKGAIVIVRTPPNNQSLLYFN